MRLASWWLSMQLNKDFSKLFSGSLKPIAVEPPCVFASSGTISSPLKLLSWNLLAPPYNRRGETEVMWQARAAQQIQYARDANADVIGLQEFWVHAPYAEMWRAFASAHGYTMHVCPRTNGKRDGCAMLVRLPRAAVSFSAFTYDDWGSRILQVAELTIGAQRESLTLMQTHLTFPHQSAHDPPMRRQQARKLAELVRTSHSPCCVFGDLNGDLSDPAVSVLTSLGGLKPPPAPDESLAGAGAEWVSHIAHTDELMACDLVLSRGACRVRDWRLEGTREALVQGQLTSDHRAVHATLQVGADAVSDGDMPCDDDGDAVAMY